MFKPTLRGSIEMTEAYLYVQLLYDSPLTLFIQLLAFIRCMYNCVHETYFYSMLNFSICNEGLLGAVLIPCRPCFFDSVAVLYIHVTNTINN